MSSSLSLNRLTHERAHGADQSAASLKNVEPFVGKTMCSAALAQNSFPFNFIITRVVHEDNNVCHLFCRLVNENEVKQWKEQAEKMRKGVWVSRIVEGGCHLIQFLQT